MIKHDSPLAVLSSVALLATLSVRASAQSVWIVGPTPGPDVAFVQIQDAVNAASDGDIILVRSGTYTEVTIDGKSLSIQAEPGAAVDIGAPFGFGSVVIQNTAADQPVSVRGIDAPLGSDGIIFQAGLVVADCAGPVLVEDGVYIPTPIGHPAGMAEGVAVSNSTSVTLVRCTMLSIETFPGFHIDPGLRVVNSNVQVFESTATGTSGIELLGGSVFVAGSLITGDVDALTLSASFLEDPEATVLDTTFVRGALGQDIRINAGTANELLGTRRSYAHSSPVREGEATLETYVGEPFELVLLAFSPALVPGALVPEFFGSMHLGTPLVLRNRGLLNAAGTRTKSITINDLGPGIEAIALFESAVFIDLLTLELRLANPTPVLIVGAAF